MSILNPIKWNRNYTKNGNSFVENNKPTFQSMLVCGNLSHSKCSSRLYFIRNISPYLPLLHIKRHKTALKISADWNERIPLHTSSLDARFGIAQKIEINIQTVQLFVFLIINIHDIKVLLKPAVCCSDIFMNFEDKKVSN